MQSKRHAAAISLTLFNKFLLFSFFRKIDRLPEGSFIYYAKKFSHVKRSKSIYKTVFSFIPKIRLIEIQNPGNRQGGKRLKPCNTVLLLLLGNLYSANSIVYSRTNNLKSNWQTLRGRLE